MNKNPSSEGMGEIVETVARWIKGFILTYGIYVMLYGHITPGGGFEGGVIIACGFILPVLATGRTDFNRKAASLLGSGGVLLFLAIALTGMWMNGGAFFRNFIETPAGSHFTLLSGGIIPIANIALGLMVASTLFLAFMVLSAFPAETSNGRTEQEAP